jgi:hypothetical protein
MYRLNREYKTRNDPVFREEVSAWLTGASIAEEPEKTFPSAFKKLPNPWLIKPPPAPEGDISLQIREGRERHCRLSRIQV